MLSQKPSKTNRVALPKQPLMHESRTHTHQDTWVVRLSSINKTVQLGHEIGQSLTEGQVIALFGELGTGKTVLVRGIAAGLGVPKESVGSPTFTLIHEYRGRILLAHADLYRIKKADELHHIGLEEYFCGKAAVAIEWADKMQSDLPADHLAIQLTYGPRNTRIVSLHGTGPQSRQLLTTIMKSHDAWSKPERPPPRDARASVPKQPHRSKHSPKPNLKRQSSR